MTAARIGAAGPAHAEPPAQARAPRLGFLGVGWIGRSRMQSVLGSGAATAAVIADPDPHVRAAAAADAPGAAQAAGLAELLDHSLDGVVIATPSALHAEQVSEALAAGLPVFCQKPVGRDAREVEQVVTAARRADRLIAADLSYRFTAAFQAMREQLGAGAIGDVYALDLAFHNAYGPDKPWFTHRDLAGGGCLIDLGTHLVDLALWLTGAHDARVVSSHLLQRGRPLAREAVDVEDHAIAELELGGGAIVRLASSWWLHAGRDCVLEVVVYGTRGALAVRDVGGSFYDFECRLQRGTSSQLLSAPPDDWGGRALESWARRLSAAPGFDPAAGELVAVGRVLDAIYDAGVAP